MLEQYWQMSTAHNFTEFETAIKRLQPPTYNIIYADRDGHIEYLFGGDMPRHKSGDFAYWSGIVPGDTSETLWHDYLTYEELPKVIDPPTGYVQNTNDPPWNAAWPASLNPKDFPPYIAAQTGTTFRNERSLHMLSNIGDDTSPPYKPAPFSFDQLIQKKLSTRVELADRILPGPPQGHRPIRHPASQRSRRHPRQWDRLDEADSKGAVLFYAWARQFMGPSMASQAGFATPTHSPTPCTPPAALKTRPKPPPN